MCNNVTIAEKEDCILQYKIKGSLWKYASLGCGQWRTTHHKIVENALQYMLHKIEKFYGIELAQRIPNYSNKRFYKYNDNDECMWINPRH